MQEISITLNLTLNIDAMSREFADGLAPILDNASHFFYSEHAGGERRGVQRIRGHIDDMHPSDRCRPLDARRRHAPGYWRKNYTFSFNFLSADGFIPILDNASSPTLRVLYAGHGISDN